MDSVDVLDVNVVHARFAADLIEGARVELLRLTTDLDFYIQRGRRAAIGTKTDAPYMAVTEAAPGNREQVVAAAAYAQWISDHIRLQCTRLECADLRAAACYANDSDQVALLERELHQSDTVVVHPPSTPPPRPGALDSTITMMPVPYLVRLDRAREWCGQALWAARTSRSKGMAVVCGHIELLLRWMEDRNE